MEDDFRVVMISSVNSGKSDDCAFIIMKKKREMSLNHKSAAQQKKIWKVSKLLFIVKSRFKKSPFMDKPQYNEEMFAYKIDF